MTWTSIAPEAGSEAVVLLAAVALLVLLAVFAGFVRLRRRAARAEAERGEALERLHESESRYRAVYESGLDMVSEVRPDGSFAFVSPSHGLVLGYSQEELRDAKKVAHVHEHDWPRVRDLCNELFRTGRSFLSEHRVRRKDGSYGWFEMAANAYVTAEGERRLISITRDISSRREAQEALRFAEAQLAQAQKMEAIGRLAGGVAHDFNNHLTVITGYAEALASELANGRTHEGLKEILLAADRAALLTRRLLAFSRRRPFQPKVIDCNAVLGGVGNMLTRLIGEDVKLKLDLEPGAGCVRADPGQLEQVVMNLAVNARDAMPEGGSLSIRSARAELADGDAQAFSGLEPGPYVSICVADSGCGMDAETVPRIFEPFFTTKAEGEGTGLGLSTAYGIVRQNGGAILVKSELGEGTTFRVLLPRTEQEASEEVLPARQPASAAPDATVLLVDDDRAVRSLLHRALDRAGYRVLAAAGPAEALALWRESGPIDLLVTDVLMPDMTGVRLHERLAEEGCACRVIFMSGYTKSLGTDPELVPGDAPYLEKPFGPRELLHAVRGVLEKP